MQYGKMAENIAVRMPADPTDLHAWLLRNCRGQVIVRFGSKKRPSSSWSRLLAVYNHPMLVAKRGSRLEALRTAFAHVPWSSCVWLSFSRRDEAFHAKFVWG